MKKILFVSTLAFLLNFQSLSAQVFDDGTNVVNFGFGLPASNRITDDFEETFNLNSNIYEYKLTNLGTIILKYEHGIHKHFGLGLNLEYSSSKASYKNPINNDLLDVSANRNIWGFFARFNGHLPLTEKFDVYGGIGLGYLYTIDKTKTTFTSNNSHIDATSKIFEFDYQFTIGARYMIKEHLGFFIELGRATTNFQIGVAFDF